MVMFWPPFIMNRDNGALPVVASGVLEALVVSLTRYQPASRLLAFLMLLFVASAVNWLDATVGVAAGLAASSFLTSVSANERVWSASIPEILLTMAASVVWSVMGSLTVFSTSLAAARTSSLYALLISSV